MPSETILRTAWCIAILTASVGAISASRGADFATTVQITQFDIRPQSVSSALQALAMQTHEQILFTPEITTGKTTQGVKGALTVDAALSQLLVGTGLSSSRSVDGMILVSPADAKGASASSGPPSAPLGARNDQSPNDTTLTQENSGHLAEIVVTARKREESLQNVPVAVEVISKIDLENNLATDLSAIGELAPQVIIGRSVTGTGAVLTIRGISSSAVDAGLDQSVSVSIDGVSLSRGRIVEAAQFDLQQVEVLEGPQALFFGKNSPAGVISIQSADPTNVPGGYVKGGYEFVADEKYGEMAISEPITSDLNARLAFRYDYMDGWIKNVAPPEANPFQSDAFLPGAAPGNTIGPRGSEASGRLTLVWQPADDFNAKLKLTLNSEALNSNNAYGETFCAGGQTVPTILGVPEPNSTCAINMTKAESNLPAMLAVNYPYGNNGVAFETSNLGLASLTLNKTMSNLALTSTTGYYDQSRAGSYPGDDSEFAQIWDTEAEHYRMFNEEARLNTSYSGPVNYMVGGYYEYSHRNWFNGPDITNIFNPLAQNYSTTNTFAENAGDSYSAFAQVRWKILSSLEFDAGARYTHDDKKATLFNIANNPSASLIGVSLYPDNTPIYPRYSDNNVSPEATLTWKPDSDQTIYGAFKTGYKAGGISNSGILSATATAANVLFGPEKTNGFEVGYKADLFDDTLRLDLTAYRYNYNGLQVTGVDVAEAFTYTIQNAAKARTQGIEGSFEWLAMDRLTLNGNAGYNHARYLSFSNAECYTGQTAAQGCVDGAQNLAGQALNRAPDVTFKMGADYRAPFVQRSTADLSISGAYSSSYQAETDYAAGGIQPSYWLLNAAVHFIPETDKYQISLIGRNLTNTYYKVVTFQQPLGTPNQYLGVFNRPREVALEASYKF
jgi:iron complex outermembrane recepter protein